GDECVSSQKLTRGSPDPIVSVTLSVDAGADAMIGQHIFMAFPLPHKALIMYDPSPYKAAGQKDKKYNIKQYRPVFQ
ncbi:MAG: hypothetical protein ACRD6B_10640, partial [Bryobacteraceae bacterium]